MSMGGSSVTFTVCQIIRTWHRSWHRCRQRIRQLLTLRICVYFIKCFINLLDVTFYFSLVHFA